MKTPISEKTSLQPGWPWQSLDWAMLLLLALASAWFLYSNLHLVQRAAIPGLDEGVYFYNGRGLWSGQLPLWAWSPAFAPLYAFFALPGIPDHLAVPALHLFLQTAAMLMFYAYVRAWLKPWGAACFSVALGFSPYLVPTFNVYGFCQLWVLSSLLALRSRPKWGLALLALGPWVRGEYAVFSGMALVAAWWWRPEWRQSVAVAFVFLCLGAAFILPQGAARSSLTFMHHYSWSVKDRGGVGNQWSESQSTVAKDFGRGDLDTKIRDYASLNPAAFKAYLWHNASISVPNLWESHNVWLLPANAEGKASRTKPVLIALLAALALGALGAWRGRPRTTEGAPGIPFELVMGALGMLTLMLGPWILFRPQHEYFAAMRPITLGWTAWVCPRLAGWVWELAQKFRKKLSS